MHLFAHQIHHRGQAHAMLAGTPLPPPQHSPCEGRRSSEDRPPSGRG
jgi:uncharacterized damage-inducible protein DinB